jgi:hypothetical protein
MNGSDTLFNVTQQVLTACPGKFAGPPPAPVYGGTLTYLGGGSGTGIGAMQQNKQQTAPMSRAIKTTEYCGITVDTDSDPTTPAVAIQGTTEGLMVALDGVAIAANQTNICVQNGVKNSGVFAVNLAVGTGACPGCDASNNYTIANSVDTLRLIYGGLHHDGTYDCNSSVRRSLVAHWTNILDIDCPAGDSSCPNGLTHAWRRSDLSGTTDAFQSLIGFAGRGIGNTPIPSAAPSPAQNPFCNSIDANMPTPAFPICSATVPCPQGFACDAGGHCSGPVCGSGVACPSIGNSQSWTCSAPTSSPPSGVCNKSTGGNSDFMDYDPIRTPCASTDGVCTTRSGLGLVQVVFLPDTTTSQPAAYPAVACDPGACDLQAPASSPAVTLQHIVCPDGTRPVTGRCFAPFHRNADGTTTFACRAARINRCFGLTSADDGRAYNKPVVLAVSGRPAAYATDNLGRLMNGSYFRVHQSPSDAHPCNTALDDTSQIGCLTDSDGCSIGYAGRSAAPLDTGFKALAVNGILPSDANIINLLTNTPPVYPISRRLYFNTLVGFSNLVGDEGLFAQCYGDNNIVRPIIAANDFVNLPAPGIQCLDYPENQVTTSTPLPGCGSATNTDACRLTPPVITNPVSGATSAQVQAILNNNCISCHSGATPPAGLDWTNVNAIVGTASTECTTSLRITAGNSASSYVIDKLQGQAQISGGCFSGQRMPFGQPQLNPTDINTFISWINAGALP